MKNEVKRITYGATLAAVIGVLMLLDRMLGSFISRYYLLVLPVIFMVYEHFTDFKAMAFASVTTFFVLFLATGSIGVLFSSFFYILIAWAGSACQRRCVNRIIRFAMFAVIIAFVYFVQIRFFSAFFLGSDTSVDQQVIQSINELVNVMRANFGLDAIQFSAQTIQFLLIGSYALAAMMEAVLILLLERFAIVNIDTFRKKNKRS